MPRAQEILLEGDLSDKNLRFIPSGYTSSGFGSFKNYFNQLHYLCINLATNSMREISIIILLFFYVSSMAQEAKFENASFEGNPGMEVTPDGWIGCELGTTPDILPGPWQVRTKASQGSTYLGLITRKDGTRESVGQQLNKPLQKGNCYVIELDLARSNTYVSFNKPIRLRIWGGISKCSKGQLLAESRIIHGTTWKTFQFEFDLETDIQYIILEAWYQEEGQSRRGNILIDNIQPITKCIRA